MNNYIDEYARYHNSPVTAAKPVPSNNSWIFTAYAEKAGLPVDKTKLEQCFELCSKDGKLIRSPGKELPPISHDEIIGIASLGLLKPSQVKDWSFSPVQIPKFSALALAKQLYELRPYSLDFFTIDGSILQIEWKHRNYFWQNNLDQMYRFAYRVRIVDRYFILTKLEQFQFYNPVHVFYYLAAKIDSKLGKSSGIRWLKYGGEKNRKAMLEQFSSDHPLRQIK